MHTEYNLSWQVFLGFMCQYTIMPLLGWAMGVLFKLPTPLAVGVILVACCPGGTASNLVTLIARADVALSVMMTTASTVCTHTHLYMFSLTNSTARADVVPSSVMMTTASTACMYAYMHICSSHDPGAHFVDATHIYMLSSRRPS